MSEKKLDPACYNDIIEAIYNCPLTYLPGLFHECLEQSIRRKVWCGEQELHKLVRRAYKDEKNQKEKIL